MIEFQEFGKIPRLNREMVITEKLDGTNAQIAIGEDGEFLVGSRKREITPENDNFGFAAWAYERKEQLIEVLGPGRHFGEWWGSGIQRKYGLQERRFSLFNVSRWSEADLPDWLHVVPTLYLGPFDTGFIRGTMTHLGATGSVAAPGFMNPEGIIVYHVAANQFFKYTFDHDKEGKRC